MSESKVDDLGVGLLEHGDRGRESRPTSDA